MDHPDLANIACLVAAAGVVLLLAGRGRAMVVGGLALIGLGGAGLIDSASGIGRLDALASGPGVVAAVLGLTVLGAAAVRALTAFSYIPRALAAVVLPGHEPGWFLLHARKAMWPRGEGIRELVEAS